MIPALHLANEEDEYFEYIQTFRSCLANNEALKELQSVKLMLIDFMSKTKQIKTEEFVAVLFKLCVECCPVQLIQKELLLQLPLNHCLQSIHILNENQMHHSAALILQSLNKHDEALEIWKE